MPAQKDAIALLRDDHRAVRKLFTDFFAAGDRAHATRRKIADRIINGLSVHAGIEETVFYPRTRSALPQEDDTVLESLEEHHIVKTTCAELEKMNPKDERFAAKMQVLRENVTHHMQEEEGELFPKVRKAFSRQELATMGQDMAAARAIVPKRPHPNAPDEPPGNLLASAVTTPMDAAVKRVGSAVKAVTGG